jgi:hypothetical protein
MYETTYHRPPGSTAVALFTKGKEAKFRRRETDPR